MNRAILSKFTSARRLDLQAKISLLLVLVILPTFVIVTIAQNKLTQPILEDEVRQIGVTSLRCQLRWRQRLCPTSPSSSRS